MSYLLDTCVILEAAKPVPCASVVTWLDSRQEESLFFSVLTLGELKRGIDKLPESRRKNALKTWLEEDLLLRFSGRILDVNRAVALHWGQMQAASELVGLKMPVVDSLIAATALAFGMTVVTRNCVDMEASGARLLNPWQ